MKYAPIILFVYNRPEHTRRTIEALAKNEGAQESELIIYSDAPRDASAQSSVDEVRTYICRITGFNKVTIVERPQNLGLAQSIVLGVTETVNACDRVIVLEDDLVTSPHFLSYMNESLEMYENDQNVASIHGYIYPIKRTLPETFFIRGADCWGWATWKRAWNSFNNDGRNLLHELEERKLTKEFNFNGTYDYTGMLRNQIAGKNNSWAIRWYASAFLKEMLTLYPGRSLVQNIGHDKTGIHGTQSRFYETTLSETKINVNRIEPKENPNARNMIERYFRSIRTPLWKRIMRKLFVWR